MIPCIIPIQVLSKFYLISINKVINLKSYILSLNHFLLSLDFLYLIAIKLILIPRILRCDLVRVSSVINILINIIIYLCFQFNSIWCFCSLCWFTPMTSLWINSSLRLFHQSLICWVWILRDVMTEFWR